MRADQTGLELVYFIDPEVPEALVGDPDRLRQVLINLCGNAIKFTAQGEVVVLVESEGQTSEEVCLHFSIRDTGIGIPPEKQAAVFEAFIQADSSTTRQYGGTGLGLAISQQLVALMGGRLWLESEEGRGSTFHFTARLGRELNSVTAAGPQGYPRSGLMDGSIQPSALRNVSVLVVDDNETNRRVLEKSLVRWGMQPTMVASGAQALSVLHEAAARGLPFPLILVDVRMPEMDGFDLAARIRETPELARTIVMMLTSSRRKGDTERCRQLEVGGYLVKPIKPSDLLQKLLAVLGPALPETAATAIPGDLVSAPIEMPRRVLLAEDNPVNRELAVRLLEKRGHTVVVAGNGKEALAAWRREPFDVILMDVQMPEMSGFEATAAIREQERQTGRHVPIIALTAHAMKEDQERCLDAGMGGYAAKPIRVDELFRTIEHLASPATPIPAPSHGSAEREGAPA